jgi:serine/threonine-protein kinase RsbW
MAEAAVLRIPAERNQLARMRDWVAEQARFAQASPEEVDDLVLAADEVVTNVIMHGYHDQPGRIELEVETRPGVVILIVRDQAPNFDPTSVPPPDLTLPLHLRPLGGMGMHLVRQSVDELYYETPAAGGNQLTLVKHISRRDSDEH